ncbi:MAG: IS110 family transposase [Desulfobacteraceae bacterium]|jgi:transposase
MNMMKHSRLERFRQLKKEIRGSNDHLIVGIDVAKDKHHAFFGTATGKALLRRLVFENSIEGFEKLLVQAEAVKVRHILSEVVFGLEPTANYHKPLAEYLIKRDQLVVLVGGEAIKKNRVLLDGRWDSHDTKDAANVGDLISQGKCLYYDYPTMPLRELRGLLSLKRRLKRQEHGLRIRIRNHLIAQYFPELDRYYGLGGREILAIVSWCLNPAVIAGMAFERFAALVAPRMRTGGQRRKLEAIWALSANSVGCEAGRMLEFEAKIMVKALRQVREAIRVTDEKIEEVCLQFPEYPHLLSIPGFGPDVSSKVLGAIGDPYRFNNEKQVLKMAGLDLSAERSGKTSKSAVPVISKKGKADLRYALYQAAMIASIRDRYVVVYFTNKLRGREREKGIKTKMRVKLAAKMLVIAWNLMKKKEPFDPSYLRTQ